MPTKQPTPPPPPPAPTDTEVPPLTEDQCLELAACCAELLRVYDEKSQGWINDMVLGKVWVGKLMLIWSERAKRSTKQNPPTSPPPPRKKG